MTMAGTPRAFGSRTEGRGASRWGCARAFWLSALLGLAGCVAEGPASEKPASSPAFAGLASPASTPSAPTANPAGRFHGLRRADVARLLGRPDLLRRDGDAEIWQYRAGSCILDIFLYEEPGGMRVAHADLRGHAPGRSCAEVVAAGRTPARTL
jgi:hypothetical protein